MRDWLINLESNVSTNGRNKELPVRIVIDSVRNGGGMCMVRGRQIHDEDAGAVDNPATVKVILAGEGIMEGLKRNVVEIGGVVGIKGPMWEVFVKGERWGVGVEWKAL